MNISWKTRKLGDILIIERGGSPRPIKSFLTDDPNGVNWIKIGDTKNVSKYIYETKQKIRKEGVKRSRLVKEGDFILSNSMSFGRPYIMKTSGCIHDGWLLLRKKENNIDNDFLYLVLGSDFVYSQFNKLAAGSTVRNLNISLVQSVKIPLPPLLEQKRIVKILDKFFKKIEVSKKNAEKNLQNSKDLFDSYLNNIFKNGGKNWEEKQISRICKIKSGSTVSKSIESSSGSVIYIKVADMNLKENLINISTSSRFVDLSDINVSKIIPNGSIVFPKRGGSIFTNKKRKIIKPTIVDLNIMALIPSGELDSDFLYYWFLKIDLADLNNGSSVPQINHYSFDNIFISYPKSLVTQQQIVKKLDLLSSQTQALEKIYTQKLTNLEELKKSILQKAFAGEL